MRPNPRLSLLVPTLLCLLLGGNSALAQSRIDCSALNSRILQRVVHYCVYLPESYDAGANERPARRYPVLYLLHGLGDNEQTLFNSGGWTLFDDLRHQHKMGDFLIVTPGVRRLEQPRAPSLRDRADDPGRHPPRPRASRARQVRLRC